MAVQGMAARVARAARLAPRVTLVLEAEAGFRMAKMLVSIARILFTSTTWDCYVLLLPRPSSAKQTCCWRVRF